MVEAVAIEGYPTTAMPQADLEVGDSAMVHRRFYFPGGAQREEWLTGQVRKTPEDAAGRSEVFRKYVEMGFHTRAGGETVSRDRVRLLTSHLLPHAPYYHLANVVLLARDGEEINKPHPDMLFSRGSTGTTNYSLELLPEPPEVLL